MFVDLVVLLQILLQQGYLLLQVSFLVLVLLLNFAVHLHLTDLVSHELGV